MNYFLVNFGPVTDRRTDRQTESDAYEPTVQHAQVGSTKNVQIFNSLFVPKIMEQDVWNVLIFRPCIASILKEAYPVMFHLFFRFTLHLEQKKTSDPLVPTGS